jgi:hypothetical protein
VKVEQGGAEAKEPPGPVTTEEVPLRQACGGYVDWFIEEG